MISSAVVAAERCERDARETSASPLVAVRRAEWAFDRTLIRSTTFEQLFAEATSVEREISALSNVLVDRLFEVISRTTSVQQRRGLLNLKRAVFNLRSAPPQSSAILGECCAELVPVLQAFDALVHKHDHLPSAIDAEVWRELDAALASRIDAPEFRLAIETSSPTLAAVLRLREGQAQGLTSRDSRSLYAYVCRFGVKANPLHLFASLVPARALLQKRPRPLAALDRCEIVFDVESLLALERELLATAEDSSRVLLELRPLVRREGGWQVWLKIAHGWGTASLRDQPLLAKLHEIFEARRSHGAVPSLTLAELERSLQEVFDQQSPESVHAAIAALISKGVLAQYVIDDLCAPARALQTLNPSDARVTCLERWHMARGSRDILQTISNEIAAAGEGSSAKTGLSYFVNSYADDDLTAAERAAALLEQPLAELKCLFTVENTFAPLQRMVRGFFRDEIAPGATVPYLELLARFLRTRATILEQFDWGRVAPDYERLVRRCVVYSGTLERAHVEALVAATPKRPAQSVCFVGPYDFEQNVFFLTNAYDGEQRFVGRYLVAPNVGAVSRGTEASLDVELAIPGSHSLNFVMRRFDTGFGFENRWAHGYRRWIGPADIGVRMEGERPVFIEFKSGKRLRFHYHGMLLASNLPIEYQLLLDEHSDSFRNPFAEELHKPRSDDVDYRAGLQFGPICLRRERWSVQAQALRELLAGKKFIAESMAVRRWLHERLVPEDLWFYQFPGTGRRGKKPRFWDLASPLSTWAFRHALSRAADEVVLTRMAPGPGGLWKVGRDAHVAELMVEV